VLSREEQRTWDDVRRHWTDEVEKPPGDADPAPSRGERASRSVREPPTAVVVGAGTVLVLLLIGARDALLAVGIATAVGWALWHHWPRLSRHGVLDVVPDDGIDARTGSADEAGGPTRPGPTEVPDRSGPGIAGGATRW